MILLAIHNKLQHLQVLLFPGHLIKLLVAQILRLQLQIPRLLIVRPELSQLGEVLHP